MVFSGKKTYLMSAEKGSVRPVASSWTKIHESPGTKKLGEPVQSLFRFEFIPGIFSYDNSGRPLAALNGVPP